MYNSLITRVVSLTIIAVVLLFMGGCREKGVSDISIETIEEETDISRVYAEYAVLGGINPSETDIEFNSEFQTGTETAIEEFLRQVEENKDAIRQGNKGILEIKYNVHNNSSDFISIVEERYNYIGGAHGNTEWIAHNIDTTTGQRVMLSDLFSDEGYRETLKRCIDEIMEANKDEYKDLWSPPEIDDGSETDFYISDGRLILYYPPYELSYFARGVVEFPIHLSEIQGYMKEEYKQRLVL